MKALKRAIVTIAAYLTGFVGVFGWYTRKPQLAFALVIMLPNVFIMSIIYFASSLLKARLEYTGLASLITGGFMAYLVLYMIAQMIAAGL